MSEGGREGGEDERGRKREREGGREEERVDILLRSSRCTRNPEF